MNEREVTAPSLSHSAWQTKPEKAHSSEGKEGSPATAIGGIVDSLTEPGWKELLAVRASRHQCSVGGGNSQCSYVIQDEFEKPYFKKILTFVDAQKKQHKIFPPEHVRRKHVVATLPTVTNTEGLFSRRC